MTEARIRKIEKKGDSCLKTGLFQWSKDFAGAASYYDEAADEYKKAGLFKQAINVFYKLTGVNQELNDAWAVGRNLENIVECYKSMEVKDHNQYIEMLGKCFRCFLVTDSIHTFVKITSGLVEYFEELGNHHAVLKIIEAALTHLDQCTDSTERCDLAFKFMEISVERNNYKAAYRRAETEYNHMTKHYPKGLKRTTFAIDSIVLALLMRDEVLAEKVLNKTGNEIQGFFTSRECEFTDNLINAYRDADQEKWNKNANSVISGSVFPAIIIARARNMTIAYKQPAPKPVEELEDQNPQDQNQAEPNQEKEGENQFF